jgi:two-component system phosphate regulon sensor histidine kinase PhoR
MNSLRALFIRNALITTVVPLAMLTLYLLHDQQESGLRALDRHLLVEASMTRQLLGGQPAADVQREVVQLDRTLGVRLTVIAPDGTVLADSERDPAQMENHGQRPEVLAARENGVGHSERHSATLNEDMRYLALTDPADPRACIYRAAVPLTAIQAQRSRTQWSLLLGALAVLAGSLALSVRLGGQLLAPMDALSRAAARFTGGEDDAHVTPDGPEPVRRLGATFNEMVKRIRHQVRRLDEAQGFLDAVVRQMPDGLLTLDARGTITRANAAAGALLGVAPEAMAGRPILGVLLNYALDREVSRVLKASRAEGEDGIQVLEVRAPDGRPLRAAVGPLEVRGEAAGAVVIFQDVSEMRRADEMRRDFVANVSHELRTPVAAIRAMVETLMLRGERRPELIGDYGPRIVDDCERINRLVTDLLLLAETESGGLRLSMQALDGREVAAEVARQVEPVAAASGTRLLLEQFSEARVHADRFALEQCLRNLIDNAARYAAGGTIRVGSRKEGERVVLSVADDGPGIPAEDLPRVFERFYRVDKARGREGGGSGLGLSIVKHLAEVQGGYAWAESAPNAGSTFYLSFHAV